MRRVLLSSLVVITLAAFEARAQTLVVDDSLQGSTTGNRGGGAFVQGGWQVTNKNDFLLWHVGTLREGAIEFSVSGLRANDNRPEGADKNELFHMYDSAHGSADSSYGGYRDNP